MLEDKCKKVHKAHTERNLVLNNGKWQALITLHRTLLNHHTDFPIVSQHPNAAPALKRVATKYAMPGRLWRHGIHSFLDILIRRLPASIEPMLTFLCIAYSYMTQLYEMVPCFENTWIECLGDLGRYFLSIANDTTPVHSIMQTYVYREIWTTVSRNWYSKTSNKVPTTGRLYHHLGILARPNAFQQLFYYAKSLCVPIPFEGTEVSIMTLFNPIMALN